MNNAKEKQKNNAPIDFTNIEPLAIEKYQQCWEQTKAKIHNRFEESIEDDSIFFEPLDITPEECDSQLNELRARLDEMKFIVSFIGRNKFCPKCSSGIVKIHSASAKEIDYFYCTNSTCGWYYKSPITIELADLFECLYNGNQ